MKQCPCGSGQTYEKCGKPIISGERNANTAEQAMRARYTAHVKVELDFLQSSMHPDKRDAYDRDVARQWSENAEWQGLDIIEVKGGGAGDDEGEVEFIARFGWQGEDKEHHERAYFKKVESTWYFYSGDEVKPEPYIRIEPKVGRNDPCPCGSGKKYKKCCGK